MTLRYLARSLVLLAGWMALHSAPLMAQSAEEVLRPEAGKRSVVRLQLQGTRVTGRLVALSAGAAQIEEVAGLRSVSLAAVDSVWVRGRATKTGMLVGAVTGAIVTGIFVGLVVSAMCEVDCDNVGLEGGLVGFGIGAVGGALVGAAIGAAIPKWRLRFP
jgi:hypothetical protein